MSAFDVDSMGANVKRYPNVRPRDRPHVPTIGSDFRPTSHMKETLIVQHLRLPNVNVLPRIMTSEAFARQYGTI